MLPRNNILFLLFILVGFAFVSCGSDNEIEKFDYKAEYDRVSKTKVAPKKDDMEKDVADIIKKKSTYMYSAVGKKDPFRSYFGDFKVIERERRIVSELQKYDISDLVLTAIVWGITEPRAVIITPEKKSFIVKRGSFIGKNWGKISSILPDKIEIIETYKDPLGRKILNKLYLELPVKSLMNKEEEGKDVLDEKKSVPAADDEPKTPAKKGQKENED